MLCSWVERLNIIKMLFLRKFIYGFNLVLLNIPELWVVVVEWWWGVDKLTVNFV